MVSPQRGQAQHEVCSVERASRHEAWESGIHGCFLLAERARLLQFAVNEAHALARWLGRHPARGWCCPRADTRAKADADLLHEVHSAAK